MIATIEAHSSEIKQACLRHRVERLELFGSACSDKFDPASSDLDFIVRFQSMPPGEHAKEFFGLQETLEALFHRPVDLVEEEAIRNPFFLEEIQRTRELLFGGNRKCLNYTT